MSGRPFSLSAEASQPARSFESERERSSKILPVRHIWRLSGLRTTLDAGPCLSAVHDGAALAADATLITAGWPVYFDELVRLTPYGSVASIPLRANGEPPFGALDLYA